jgi:acetyl esterase
MRRTHICAVLAGYLLFPFTGAAAAQDAGLTIRRDLVYATRGDTKLRLDAYIPPSEGPLPAFIWVHGGKWQAGDKADPSDARFAESMARTGMAAFSINYRLARKEAPDAFPEAIEDVQAAVVWVREHADEFNVDPALIAIAGNSAGGHLAALVATLGEGPLSQGSRVAAAASFSGPLDMEGLLHIGNDNVRGAVAGFLGCSTGPNCEARARAASPIAHLDRSDSPLFLTNSSDEEIPIEDTQQLYAGLQDAGVSSQLVEVPGDQHGIGYYSYQKGLGPEGQTLPQMFVAFLARELHIGDALAVPGEATSSGQPGTSKASDEKVKGGVQETAAPRRGQATSGVPVAITVIALFVAVAALTLTLILLRRERARHLPTARADQGDDPKPRTPSDLGV